tara:strand:+ start:253 stop:393 length:141 start_codon:yes stop_codon:yes gene_type:complete
LPELEAALKYQFMKDEFDLESIKASIVKAPLDLAKKQKLFDLINSY